MLDNNEVIGKLKPVKPMSAADRQMLDKYSSVIGRHMCRYPAYFFRILLPLHPAYFFRILLTSYRYPRPNMFRWLSS